MAKRGERRPWRIRYVWDSGIKGTETRHTEEDALWFAGQLFRNAEVRDGAITVTVENRDTGESRQVTPEDCKGAYE